MAVKASLSGEMVNCSLVDECPNDAFPKSNDSSPVISTINTFNDGISNLQESADPVPNISTNSEKKKKGRRKGKGGKNRQYKRLYTTMTADDQSAQDNLKLKKSKSRRRKRFSTGHAMAPDNTTQFLMDIHDPDSNFDEIELPHHHRRHQSTSLAQDIGSATASEECYSSADDEDFFLEREFSADYENYQLERINSMSKDELVKEYLNLEQKCENLELRLRTDFPSGEQNFVMATESGESHESDVDSEVLRLRNENEELRRENESLRAQLLRTENKENEPDLES